MKIRIIIGLLIWLPLQANVGIWPVTIINNTQVVLSVDDQYVVFDKNAKPVAKTVNQRLIGIGAQTVLPYDYSIPEAMGRQIQIQGQCDGSVGSTNKIIITSPQFVTNEMKDTTKFLVPNNIQPSGTYTITGSPLAKCTLSITQEEGYENAMSPYEKTVKLD